MIKQVTKKEFKASTFSQASVTKFPVPTLSKGIPVCFLFTYLIAFQNSLQFVCLRFKKKLCLAFVCA